jgi:excisionase family DNA binding protein
MLLKLCQVSERLNCSLSNVYALVESGRLTVTITGAGGRGYRVTEAELNRFIDAGRKGRNIAPPSPRSNPSPFKHLDGQRLREAWREAGH